ncbi:threonine aspartase 1 isoform X2 [Aethina tumida]|nr:threonine aspartase 1 isoform X2 [Aethina tumida]
MEVIRNHGSALEAVKAAVMVLEDNPLTNAGFGSNLNTNGEVEMDASVMDGKSLLYGGCGSVLKVKNPIELAYHICLNQSKPLPLGLIRPTLLVGKGGLEYAKEAGLTTVTNKSLVSKKALKGLHKYKNMYQQTTAKLDTVGAVCIDERGHVASACSSGGLLLKKPGRVGQAALYACGTWADSFSPDEPCVAVSTTGCGEHLVQTQLAKEISEDLKFETCETTGLHKSMTEKFMHSRYLHNVENKLAGALVIHANVKRDEIMVLWGHSTQTMSLGYMTITDKFPKGVISKLPDDVSQGQTVNVGGTYFYNKTDVS